MEQIKKKLKINTDRCFIVGNGEIKFDTSLLKNEFTIVCNTFLEDFYEINKTFVPNIICCENSNVIKNLIISNFQFNERNTYEKFKSKIIYVLQMTKFLKNTFNTETWEIKNNALAPLINNLSALINDNKNIYTLSNFEPFKLSNNIYNQIGSDASDTDKTYIINNNFNYILKYQNIIPTMSLLIAKELGFKHIYLIGCNGLSFDKYFYETVTRNIPDDTTIQNLPGNEIYDSMMERNNDFLQYGIDIINAESESYLDFLPTIDFIDFSKKYPNCANIISLYDSHCKEFIKIFKIKLARSRRDIL